jgi:pyridine nucleotide-disulfide oxidoreductase family protein
VSQRVVLLGGGHAHVHVLQDLARQPLVGAEVLLISPFAQQTYSGMVPGVVAGHYQPTQCQIALAPLAAEARAHRVEAAAVGIDATQRRVLLTDGRHAEYDILSIDTGAAMDRSRLPGAREHALFVRPIEHFVSLLPGLLSLAEQRVLDVVVIGGGAAGVELALALQHRLNPQRGDERARVALVTGGGEALEGFALMAMRRVARVLGRHRITVIRDRCDAVEAHAVVLGSGARLACDAAVIATGAEAPAWLQGSGLALNDRGFICTGATLQSTSHAEVLAVGDVSARVDINPSPPRNGVHAVRAGPPLALNLRRLIIGGELQAHPPQKRALNLLACGEKSAIAVWGDWTAQGPWVWWWKDRIDRRFVAKYSRSVPPAASTELPTPLSAPAPASASTVSRGA